AGNVAVGCTLVLNPAAAALLAQSRPPPGFFHDWWAYALVTAAGGACLCDPAEVILYRQHGANLVGAARGPARRALAALRRGPRPFTNRLRALLDALAAQPEQLSPEARAAVARLRAALAGGIVPRAAALWALRERLRRRGALETLLFRLWFLIG
ncbi:MAG: glycosyltransferase, partial [Acetobacteraceae bacterium]